MMWRKPGVDVHDTSSAVLYHVGVGTVANALKFYGGITTLPLRDEDWLRISEQHLREFTSGVVYRDDIGELTRARELLSYYPDDVLRFLLVTEWNAVGSDWFPIGRVGSRGDQLGVRLQAAKVCQHLMHIAFMVSRRYFHYKKWFGTLFKQLPIASSLEPILLDLVEEYSWQKVEEKIGTAAVILLQQQNKLGITPEITLQVKEDDGGRHHNNYDFWGIGSRIAECLQPPMKALMENQTDWLDERTLLLWNEEIGKWPLLLQK